MVINPRGVPEWDLMARAMVRLPEPRAGLTRDEVRVVDVLTANAVLAATDPSWDAAAGTAAIRTPAGWVWAHLFGTRQVALVPAEARGAFRYVGGIATLHVARDRRGLRVDEDGRGLRVDGAGPSVPVTSAEELSERLVGRLQERLGHSLPPAYATFLASTNGARPAAPGVHPGYGFVVDQPFFGLDRTDRHQDLVFANQWFGDRLTSNFLGIGYVQGGLLAVKVAGGDEGSVWYADDDDYRDDDRFDAEYFCAHLLHRCAADFNQFWRALVPPPDRLLRLVSDVVRSGWAVSTSTPQMGASLPRTKRAP
jgi:hypothetical protein